MFSKSRVLTAFALGVALVLVPHSGAAQSAGIPDDGASHPPPATGALAYNTLVPGTTYTDSVFGTPVLRVTSDHSVDDLYARNMWWNADETRYLHRNPMGTAFADYLAVITVATGQVTHNGIPVGSAPQDAGFDPVNPNVLYYISGSSIHQVTLGTGSLWTDTIYFTAPGGQAIKTLGGTINWLDAAGRYLVVRYGPEPSVYVYDRQNLAAGPYANPVDGASTIDAGSYVGITPDGQFLVGYQGANGTAGMYHMGQGVSWRLDHTNRAVAGSPTVFWSLCGDHGTFISPSDGRDYMVVSNCEYNAELWRVDITNNAVGLDQPGQEALPNNLRLMAWATWNEAGSHVSTVARGPLQDWAFYATEDGTDTFNSGTADGSGHITPWHVYRQEIIAFNVLTGQVRRLAHHRSRSVTARSYYTPRLSASWGGAYVGWASNFNQSGSGPIDGVTVDVYAVPFGTASGGGTAPPPTPPTVSVTAPTAGALLAGATTVSATAADPTGIASVQFLLDGGNLGTAVTTAPYGVVWTPTAAYNGTHVLTAVARDMAGNAATATGVTVTVSMGNTSFIAGVAATAISASGATITWTTTTAADSQVNYGTTTAYGSSTTLNSTLLTAHSQSLTGLTASTLYHYHVTSHTTSGTLATSADATFTTSSAGNGASAVPVQWTSLVNVTVTGATIQKTGGCDGCQDAGAVSQQQIPSGDGAVAFTASETATMRVIGLSHGNPGTSMNEIAFALRLQAGSVEVLESGAYKADTTFTTGDVLRVAVVSGRVTYAKNGAVFYTSTATPTYPLLVDTSFEDLGATITNAVITGTGAVRVAPADFDGSGKSDRTIFRPSVGVWYSLLSGGSATATTWGVSTDVDVAGDYDGDGRTDVAVWRPSTGTWFIIYSSDNTEHMVSWGVAGDIPLAGDVDGDGKADLVIWRPSTGTWFVNGSSGRTFVASWGTSGDQPFLADFDGDGKADFAIYRPSVGVWFVSLSGGGSLTVPWGMAGDIPIVGDWDGDGKADAGIFRPSTGLWLIHLSSGGTIAVTWGVSGDIPLAGDEDGDGRSDFIIWRPSTGVWFTQFAAGGTAAVSWGRIGDKPIGRVPGS